VTNVAKFEYGAILVGVLAALTILAESKLAIVAACCLPLAAAAGLWLLGSPVRWMVVFFAFAILLPPLPIALGNSGPHPAVAVALIGLFSGLAYVREWQFRVTPLTTAVAHNVVGPEHQGPLFRRFASCLVLRW